MGIDTLIKFTKRNVLTMNSFIFASITDEDTFIFFVALMKHIHFFLHLRNTSSSTNSGDVDPFFGIIINPPWLNTCSIGAGTLSNVNASFANMLYESLR